MKQELPSISLAILSFSSPLTSGRVPLGPLTISDKEKHDSIRG